MIDKISLKVCEKIIHLSRRESQCFYFIAQGHTAKEIGRILKLSNRTVEFYVKGIKSKTGLMYKSDLVNLAIKNNLLVLNFSKPDHLDSLP